MFDPLEHARRLEGNRWWAIALRWSAVVLVTAAIHVTFFSECPTSPRALACEQATHMQSLVAAHRDRVGSCPRDVAELVANRSSFVDVVDPWGTTYEIGCGADRVVIVSAGPDRARGSGDDVSGGSCGGWLSSCGIE